MERLVGDLAAWLVQLVESLGYAGVGILLAMGGMLFPVPAEIVLPFSGYLAGQGRLWAPAVVIAATLGSTTGSLLLYYISLRLGEQQVHVMVTRYGRYIFLRDSDVVRAQWWFDRNAGRAVFICRLIPLLRSIISIPAGIGRMPVGSFVLFTAMGSLVWNTTLIGLGWLLGHHWAEVNRYTSHLQYGVVAAIAMAAGCFVWNRQRARYKHRKAHSR
jgi:membrane protein DedA with SNARE-associated domain